MQDKQLMEFIADLDANGVDEARLNKLRVKAYDVHIRTNMWTYASVGAAATALSVLGNALIPMLAISAVIGVAALVSWLAFGFAIPSHILAFAVIGGSVLYGAIETWWNFNVHLFSVGALTEPEEMQIVVDVLERHGVTIDQETAASPIYDEPPNDRMYH